MGSIVGGVTGALSKSEYLSNAGQILQKSKMLTNASDNIKRATGLDIRRAMGGKTAAEIAEERLKNEYQSSTKYTGGYQGIQIPISEQDHENKINTSQAPSKWRVDDEKPVV